MSCVQVDLHVAKAEKPLWRVLTDQKGLRTACFRDTLALQYTKTAMLRSPQCIYRSRRKLCLVQKNCRIEAARKAPQPGRLEIRKRQWVSAQAMQNPQ